MSQAASKRPATRPAGEAPALQNWSRDYLLVALPAFLLGFTASVVADRLVFVAWSFASALSFGFFLHASWPRPKVSWRRALQLTYLATFTWLVFAHYGALRLGLAAFLPAVGSAP